MKILVVRIWAALLASGPAVCAPSLAAADATRESAPTAPAIAGTTRVYVCVRGGRPEYADRPCARTATAVDVAVVAAPPAIVPPGAPATAEARGVGTAGRTDPTARSTAAPRMRAKSANGALGAPAPESARCRSLRAAGERLDARLRAGYTSRDGEKLRARHRELRAARRAERCPRSAGPR